jgi:hypothetical protein
VFNIFPDYKRYPFFSKAGKEGIGVRISAIYGFEDPAFRVDLLSPQAAVAFS